MAKQNTLITSKCADKAFLSTGFSNRKDAKVVFRNHEQTKCHKEAVQTVVALPRDYVDLAELLSSQRTKEKANNQQMLLRLNLIVVANQFVSNKSAKHRLSIFGKFTEKDTVARCNRLPYL